MGIQMVLVSTQRDLFHVYSDRKGSSPLAFRCVINDSIQELEGSEGASILTANLLAPRANDRNRHVLKGVDVEI